MEEKDCYLISVKEITKSGPLEPPYYDTKSEEIKSLGYFIVFDNMGGENAKNKLLKMLPKKQKNLNIRYETDIHLGEKHDEVYYFGERKVQW